VEYRKIRRNVLINQMEKLRTCPAIIIMVALILSHEGGYDIDPNILVTGRVELFLSTATSEQFKIGWTAFIQGLHSSHWMITQNEYYSDEGISSYVSTGNVWASRLIGLLYEYADDDIWKHRNEIVHGTKLKELRHVRLGRLQQKVKDYYDKLRKVLTKKEKAIFKMPVTQRLKTGTYNLQLWLDITDHIYFDNTQKRPQGTSRAVMHNWLFNEGTNTERNFATQVDAPRNAHNRLDDTH
jgi:hypothetical protein